MEVLRIDSLLDAVAAPEPAPGAGSSAALVGALGAALCAKAARLSGDPGAAAQADALRRRLQTLAEEDSAAFLEALHELRARRGDVPLGRALARAAECPLRIGEACADVAVLAAGLAGRCKPEVQPDARGAAALAAGAARAAALLVEANLGAGPGDERVVRASRVADEAAAVAR
ncbi:MAG TPA: cyclodeaminase/cyclohydrolase family protein [Gaiellaceae bacterium]|nr:cyclodeaminase/cyclohydrolase family protein [Gaiellaceae bacterium]